jgi:hypothetical protein
MIDFGGNLMAPTRADKTKSSDFAIFGRLLSRHDGTMSPKLARYVLTLGFTEADQVCMEELAAGNQQGGLPAEDYEELMGYVNAGHLLAFLHSKARKSLKQREVS